MPDNFAPTSKREILHAVFSRWLAILIVFIIVAGSVIVGTLLGPKWFRSRVTFQAQMPREMNPLGSPQRMYQPTEVFLRTQQAIILSQDVVSRALARLDGASERNLESAAERIRDNEQERLLRHIKHIKVTTPVGESFTNSEVFFINVEVSGDSDSGPKNAKDLTDLLAEEYRKKFNALQSQLIGESTAILKDEVTVLKKQFDDANQNLADFISTTIEGDLIALRAIASASTPLSVAGVSASFDQEVKTLRADLTEKAALKDQLDKELARVENITTSDPLDIDNIPVVPDRILKDNPSVTALAKKLAELRLRAIELQPRYTKDFQERRNIAEEIRLASQLLIDSLAKVSVALDQDIITSTARRDELQQILHRDQEYMKQLSGKYVQYTRLQDEITSAQEEYLLKKAEFQKAKTAETVAEKRIFVTQLDQASLPDRAVRPVLWINAIIGIAVGALLAVGYGFLADYYDHRFKNVEQAERILDLPVLGSVGNLGRRIIVRQ